MSDKDIEKLVDALAARGLVVGPASIMDDAMRLQKAKTRLMRRNKLTPYEVAKFKLLPNQPTLKTVKNMIDDGRIRRDEVFTDKSGKRYITKACIERLTDNL